MYYKAYRVGDFKYAIINFKGANRELPRQPNLGKIQFGIKYEELFCVNSRKSVNSNIGLLSEVSREQRELPKEVENF